MAYDYEQQHVRLRLMLRLAIFIINAVNLYLLFAAKALYGQSGVGSDDGPAFPDWVPFVQELGIGACIYSLIWNFAAFLCIPWSSPRRPRPGTPTSEPVHPGLDVSFDMFAWILLFVSGGFQAANAATKLNSSSDFTCLKSMYEPDYLAPFCSHLSRFAAFQTSAAVLLWLSGTIHFLIWLRACYATHRYRAIKFRKEVERRVDEQQQQRGEVDELAELHEIVQKRADEELAHREGRNYEPPAYPS